MSTSARGATFDGNVAADWLEFRLRWFDHWLKGEENGVDRTSRRARSFLMGGGSGQRTTRPAGSTTAGAGSTRADWPLPETRACRTTCTATAACSREAARAEAPRRCPTTSIPPIPCPTIGGPLTRGEPVFEGGAFDQREDPRFFGCTHPGLPLAARRDVLVFETPPLAEDVAVIGPIEIELWVDHRRARHRLHGQADRRPPAGAGLSARLCA